MDSCKEKDTSVSPPPFKRRKENNHRHRRDKNSADDVLPMAPMIEECWHVIFRIIEESFWSFRFDENKYDCFHRTTKIPILDTLSTLSTVNKYFRDFVKIFYWKPLELRGVCSYMCHKTVPGKKHVADGSFDKLGRSLIVFRRKNLFGCTKNTTTTTTTTEDYNGEEQKTLLFLEESNYDAIFRKTPHYYCYACNLVVQCARCVHTKDCFFTTEKDYKLIETLTNDREGGRHKIHQKGPHMKCYLCKQDSVIKLYLANTVENKYFT